MIWYGNMHKSISTLGSIYKIGINSHGIGDRVGHGKCSDAIKSSLDRESENKILD